MAVWHKTGRLKCQREHQKGGRGKRRNGGDKQTERTIVWQETEEEGDGERERDKKDADIKLEARQIKREGKNWSTEGQKKKHRKLAARVTQQQW